MMKSFGAAVHELLLSRYGHPVLQDYKAIQALKAADKETTVAMLLGDGAIPADQFCTMTPEDVVNRIMEKIAEIRGRFSREGTVDATVSLGSGLTEIIGNALGAPT